MTLRELARQLGVDPSSVRKAIGNGRLERCVGRDPSGRPFITDVRLAREEWERKRDPSRVRETPRRDTSMTRDRQRLRTGALVATADVERTWARTVIAMRDRMRAIPHTARQRGLVNAAGEEQLERPVDDALLELAARGEQAEARR